jgi:hypothetical protein
VPIDKTSEVEDPFTNKGIRMVLHKRVFSINITLQSEIDMVARNVFFTIKIKQ